MIVFDSEQQPLNNNVTPTFEQLQSYNTAIKTSKKRSSSVISQPQ